MDPQTWEAADLVLALVADYDAVLATGHLSGEEYRSLSDRAGHFGITRLLFTHPSYTVPGLDPAAVRDLLDLGRACRDHGLPAAAPTRVHPGDAGASR